MFLLLQKLKQGGEIMAIPEGVIIAIESKTGKIVPHRNYTKTERVIRWIGRMLRNEMAMRYHELTPIGVMFNGGIIVYSSKGWTK